MIILIGSQKDGAGKSTLATNLTVELSARGKDVMLVDADAQKSASRWFADREAAGRASKIGSVEKAGNLYATLLDFDARYEYVVVDVAGRDSKEMRTAMTAAHRLVVALRPSQLDLDTLAHMNDLVEQVKDFNPSIDVRSVLTQVPTNSWGRELEEAGGYLSDFQGLSPMRSVIHERKAYRDVVGEGLGVSEWSDPKARIEMVQFTAELLEPFQERDESALLALPRPKRSEQQPTAAIQIRETHAECRH